MARLFRSPPPIPPELDPKLNRYLHDLTAFISPAGGIDTDFIPGFSELILAVNTLNNSVQQLKTQVDILSQSLNALQLMVNGHSARITTLEGSVQILMGNPVIHNVTTTPVNSLGLNGDLAVVTTAPRHIYTKVGGAWLLVV